MIEMKFALSLLVALPIALPVLAQNQPIIMPPIRQPWPQLVRYLELTAEQQTGLLRLQTEWQRYLIEKQQRVGEVERELSRETNAKVPDPMSLGLRYVELESICREAKDRDSQNVQSARKLLTPAQTTKLQTLESVYTLLPIVNEANQANLIQAPEFGRIASNSPGVVAQIANVIVPSYPGCRYPVQPN